MCFDCDREDAGGGLRVGGPQGFECALGCKKGLHGFTLIELIVVMVLVGIMSAVAIPKMMDRTFSQSGFGEGIKAALRHARNTAIASRRYGCVDISSAGVDVMRDTRTPETVATALPVNCSTTVTFPGADSGSCGHQLCPPSGITVTTATLVFDPRGRLVNPATTAVVGVAASITVSFSGDALPLTITVEPETGYVQ